VTRFYTIDFYVFTPEDEAGLADAAGPEDDHPVVVALLRHAEDLPAQKIVANTGARLAWDRCYDFK
jgi:hypothetical protein